MKSPRNAFTRQQTLAFVIVAALASVGLVWLMVSIAGNGTSPTSAPASGPTTTGPPTTVIETTTSVPDPTTTTLGVFDEVAAVEAFIEEFAAAIAEGDSVLLFESLHPAVKATYEEGVCKSHIDEHVLRFDDYHQVGPVIGPFDSEFGEFPITSYEAEVAFDIEGEPMETTAIFSLTEGVVRRLVECS